MRVAASDADVWWFSLLLLEWPVFVEVLLRVEAEDEGVAGVAGVAVENSGLGAEFAWPVIGEGKARC